MDTAAGKYYFTADVHMGSKADSHGLLEKQFVDFLHSIPQDAKALYLLGDIFDFWVDYKEVVPRGYVRTLAALSELVDRGVEVFFYPGNHDWWVTDYFEKELGVKIVVTAPGFSNSTAGGSVWGTVTCPERQISDRGLSSVCSATSSA